MNEENQTRFEERAFGEYFCKSIRKVNNSQFPFVVDCEDMKTFVRKDKSGNYVREELNLMWFGWNLKTEDLKL